MMKTVIDNITVVLGLLFFTAVEKVEGEVRCTDGMVWLHRDVVQRVVGVMNHLLDTEDHLGTMANYAEVEILEWWLANTKHAQLVLVDNKKEIVIHNTGVAIVSDGDRGCMVGALPPGMGF